MALKTVLYILKLVKMLKKTEGNKPKMACSSVCFFGLISFGMSHDE